MRRLILLALVLLVASTAWGYKVTEVKDAATIKGTIMFSGEVPADEIISIDRDALFCGEKIKAGKYIVKDGQVKNVVVWVDGVKAGKAIPKRDVKIIIEKCRVKPHVQVGFVGNNFVFKNKDDILHTVQLKEELAYQKKRSSRPLAEGATIYNIALPIRDLEIKKPIKKYHAYSSETGFIRVTSNTHTWMRGYIFIFDHPYGTVTDDNGGFEIKGLPPGEYTLNVWHEGFGQKKIRFKVGPGETKTIKIDLSKKEASIGGAPSVVFAEKRYDFGEIKLGESISHDFALYNKGTDKLRIVELIPA